MVRWLRTHTPFPPPSQALDEPNGLLAAGGDLSSKRLLSAYSQGIFPWYSEDPPILWWSPNPRMVLFTDEFRISQSLRKVIRQQTFEVRVNTAFRAVMEKCAEPRRGRKQYSATQSAASGTWIMPEMIDAYERLHLLGHAHSVESWVDGALVGGLYGVQIGCMFFGESMFARETNASKVALAFLVQHLREAGFPMIDCQQETRHLASLGARPIWRDEFTKRVVELVKTPITPLFAPRFPRQ
jgi:leucyl/phenylalanyl-tRNA--protein transferase